MFASQVLLPFIINIGSDRFLAAWDRYRSRGEDWERLLADTILHDAPDLAFSRQELASWIAESGVLPALVSGDADGLNEATASLAVLRIGSATLTPEAAQAESSRAVLAATAIVLDAAPDSGLRMLGEVLRLASTSKRALDELAGDVRAVLDAQTVQDDDLREILTLVRGQHRQPPEGLTILIADDEPATTAGLRRRLVSDGFNVVEAHTVHEALHVLTTSTVAVAIVDMMLPVVGIQDVLSEDELAAATITAIELEDGGREIIRQLPVIQESTKLVVWTRLPRGELEDILTRGIELFSKGESHARLVRRIAELTAVEPPVSRRYPASDIRTPPIT